MKNIFNERTKRLCRLILSLETVEECEKFLEDVCTVKEIHEIAQRCEVADLLLKGSVYTDIVKATGASTATISRVNRSIRYGEGGYRLAAERLEADK